MKRKITSTLVVITLALAFFTDCDSGGSQNSSAAILAAINDAVCSDPDLDSTEFAETSLTAGINTFQLIAIPSAGAARHIRIEGALTQAPSGHGTIYLATGYTDSLAGTSSTPTAAAGDGRLVVNLYQGGPLAYTTYGGVTAYGTDNGDAPTALGGTGTSLYSTFASSASDICFDISSDATPKVTIWGTGYKGANCTKRCTLTSSNAIINKADWTSSVGVGSTGSTSTYYKTGSSASGVTATKVVTFSTTAL